MDIGTNSVRSDAAMGLFLANHSAERIMLMGRWKFQVFLVCIRPQVIEWSNIRHNSHADASGFDMADPNVARVPPRRFNGPDIEWTNNMSGDMIRHNSHADASWFDMTDPNVAQVPPRRFNGPDNSLITLGSLSESVKSNHTKSGQKALQWS
jgi:hypothetical protein